MKPVEEDRLADTLERVRVRLAEKRGVEEVGRLKEVLAEVAPEAAENVEGVEDAHASNRYEKMINIKDRGQIFRVDVDSIEKIDAAGDYMCIYTGDNTLILRETMKDLEKRLDPRRFQRVHRSTIVNLDQVQQVKPHTNGECFLVLGSGSQVKVVALLSRRGGAVRPLAESGHDPPVAGSVPTLPLTLQRIADLQLGRRRFPRQSIARFTTVPLDQRTCVPSANAPTYWPSTKPGRAAARIESPETG